MQPQMPSKEAILNAMLHAELLMELKMRRVEGLPVDKVKDLLDK
jgi:hypothetical protein